MDEEVEEETAVFISKNIIASEDASPKDTREGSSPKRDKWDRQSEFILTLVGYAVGIANLWRFPYLCAKNGGGAFLIPFLFFMFVTGIPFVYLELSLGQFSGISSLFVWRLCPLFKGIGWGAAIVSGMISIYYIVILAWTMLYLIYSFYPTLPWSTCSNWWNTDQCIGRLPSDVNSTMITSFTNVTTPRVSDPEDLNKWNITNFFSQEMLPVESKGGKTATEEFWERGVLHRSAGLEDMGVLQPHLVGCLFVSWLLVFLCLVKGVKSLGKVVYVTALLPYILLTVLLVRGLLLPGAIDGILFYVYPDFTQLANFNVWVEAGIQVFFSLGASFGPLITMASFNDFNNNCFRDSVVVCVVDALSSFFNGFVVFSVVGFIANEANVTVTEVASQGPGLVLLAYPEAISTLPVPQLWAVIFFLMLLLLGLDTQFGLGENVLTSIIDAFPRQLSQHRTLVTAVITSVFFLLGLPMTMNGGIYVYQLIDWFATAFWVWLAAFLECLIIGWIYGVGKFCKDVELMQGRQPGTLMKFCWCISTPLIVLILFIVTVSSLQTPTYDEYTYPSSASALGFVIAMLPIIPVPVIMVIELRKARGTLWKRFVSTLRPSSDWKPAKVSCRRDYESNNRNHQFVLPVKTLIPRHLRSRLCEE